MSKINTESPKKIGFLLIDNFTMISLACAVEPLRMANQLSGEVLYEWFNLSWDGAAVQASDGIRVVPDASVQDCGFLDVLIVAGGINVSQAYQQPHLKLLREWDRNGAVLGGLCSGAFLLADAGLLDGYDCCVHWEYSAVMREAYPKIRVSDSLYCIDRKRMTSSGGVAPMDMMLHMIRHEFGRELSAAISDMFICERVRAEEEQQRTPLRHLFGTSQPKLEEAVKLMENNIEEPIELHELAQLVDLSKRQLQRLFQNNLQCTPSKYYMRLRLKRARQMLLQSAVPLADIVAATGFCSSAHFSNCYRIEMGVSPSKDRHAMEKPGSDTTVDESKVSASRQVITRPRALPEPASVATHVLRRAHAESTFGSMPTRGKASK